MIILSKEDGTVVMLNPAFIESIEPLTHAYGLKSQVQTATKWIHLVTETNRQIMELYAVYKGYPEVWAVQWRDGGVALINSPEDLRAGGVE